MSRFSTADPKFEEKWAAENVRLKQAIAMSMSLWTALEHEMAGLFSAVIEARTDMAEVAFFSVSSTEGRIRMLDSVTAHKYAENDLVFLMWGKIKGKIARKKAVRNAIAHGAMAVTAISEGAAMIHSVRVKPAFNDKVEWRQLAADTSKILEAGLSANDIDGFNTSVGRLNDYLSKLQEVIRTNPPMEMQQADLGKELPPLCRELGLALNVLVPNPETRTDPKPADLDEAGPAPKLASPP